MKNKNINLSKSKNITDSFIKFKMNNFFKNCSMKSKELLKEILLEQKKRIEEARSKDFVIREKLDEIKKFVGIKNNIIITGVRRCGKSVFLSQIINNFF